MAALVLFTEPSAGGRPGRGRDRATVGPGLDQTRPRAHPGRAPRGPAEHEPATATSAPVGRRQDDEVLRRSGRRAWCVYWSG
jgi:hypothetical protein